LNIFDVLLIDLPFILYRDSSGNVTQFLFITGGCYGNCIELRCLFSAAMAAVFAIIKEINNGFNLNGG
jgi:hypothetical protein